MNSSKVLEKKAFLQHYVLNRAGVEISGFQLDEAVRDAEKAWDEIEKKCKKGFLKRS